jgi:hypothetical protein
MGIDLGRAGWPLTSLATALAARPQVEGLIRTAPTNLRFKTDFTLLLKGD